MPMQWSFEYCRSILIGHNITKDKRIFKLPLEILVTTNNMSALQDSRVDARLGEVSGGDETVVAAANDESRVLGARKAAAQAALS